MRVAGVVGEDHLACFRGFGFASEGRVSLGSGGVANGEVSGHLVEVGKAAVTPVTDKVATDSWGNWSSSCGEWLNSIGYRLSAARRPASTR